MFRDGDVHGHCQRCDFGHGHLRGSDGLHPVGDEERDRDRYGDEFPHRHQLRHNLLGGVWLGRLGHADSCAKCGRDLRGLEWWRLYGHGGLHRDNGCGEERDGNVHGQCDMLDTDLGNGT